MVVNSNEVQCLSDIVYILPYKEGKMPLCSTFQNAAFQKQL